MNENIKEIMNEFDKINIVLPSQSELARCGYGVFNKDNETKIFDYNEFAKQQIATVLDKAGYRKQSETVKEFAEQLKTELSQAIDHNTRVMEESVSKLGTYNKALITNNALKGIYDFVVRTAAKYGKEE